MKTARERPSNSVIGKMKKNISRAYSETNYEQYRNAPQEWDVKEDDWIFNKSDPQLVGWEPYGYGLCGPIDANIILEEITSVKGLDPFNKIEVSYRIELPSGEVQREKALFVKSKTPRIHDVETLRTYLEGAVGEDIIVFNERLLQPIKEAETRFENILHMTGDDIRDLHDKMAENRKNFPEIPAEYLESAVSPLCAHLKEMAVIAEILAPMEKEGSLLFKAIERRVDAMFNLALTIRQMELEDLHLSDALRGKAVASGGDRGGRTLAERSSAHAIAWKNNFAQWFQPVIAKYSSRGISRDDAIDLAQREWPSEGFVGLPGLPRQKAFPSRQTMLNTMKELEKSGKITRKSPKKGNR